MRCEDQKSWIGWLIWKREVIDKIETICKKCGNFKNEFESARCPLVRGPTGKGGSPAKFQDLKGWKWSTTSQNQETWRLPQGACYAPNLDIQPEVTSNFERLDMECFLEPATGQVSTQEPSSNSLHQAYQCCTSRKACCCSNAEAAAIRWNIRNRLLERLGHQKYHRSQNHNFPAFWERMWTRDSKCICWCSYTEYLQPHASRLLPSRNVLVL